MLLTEEPALKWKEKRSRVEMTDADGAGCVGKRGE